MLEARQNVINAVKMIMEVFSAMKFKPGAGLPEIEDEYQDRVQSAMENYIEGDRAITKFKNQFRRVVNDGFFMAATAGWADGGNGGAISDDLTKYVNEQIQREIAFVDDLFADLRTMRASDKPDEDKAKYIADRSSGYTKTIQGIYNYAKMLAQRNREGRWELGATENHCSTCGSLNGQVHPLTWFVSNGFIPRQAGSRTLECHGYYCDCRIVDPKTGEQLI